MSFRAYLRWDGAIAVAVGAALFAVGVVERHEGPADAVLGGLMMTAGSGLFLALRHRVPLRRPGAWFTHRPIAASGSGPATARSAALVAWLLGGQATAAALTVGLSVLTGFWLTYMDFGVWTVAIGLIKLGPGAAAVDRQEAVSGTTYHVSRRPLRGVVRLTCVT